MLYKEYLPANELREQVECYWKFCVWENNIAPDEPFMHVFPPEGSCSLIFIKLFTLNKEFVAFVGPSTKISQVPVYPNSLTFGIRLNPGFSNIFSPELPESLVNTTHFIPPPEILNWQHQLLQNLSFDFNPNTYLDELLLNNLNFAVCMPDKRIRDAVNFMIEKKGITTLPEVADVACLSSRQLQRVFLRATGMSVKNFCQIRRLRNAIVQLYVKNKSLASAPEIGFSDSSHFYKSFRKAGNLNLDKFLNHISLIEHQLL